MHKTKTTTALIFAAVTAGITPASQADSGAATFAGCVTANNGTDWVPAEKVSRARLANDPFDGPGLICLGTALNQQKRYKEALKAFEKMEYANPMQYRWTEMQASSMYLGLADAHKGLGNDKLAEYYGKIAFTLTQESGRRGRGVPIKLDAK